MFEMLNNFLYFGKNLFLDVNHQKKVLNLYLIDKSYLK